MVSDESKQKAEEALGGALPFDLSAFLRADLRIILLEYVAAAIEASWQQGFGDGRMSMRLEHMREVTCR